MPGPTLMLLKLLYMGSEVALQYGEHTSQTMRTERAPKQGCPLSLIKLYISDLERRLEKSKIGFKVRLMGNILDFQQPKDLSIGGLLSADDLVSTVHSRKDMEDLPKIVSCVECEE